MLARLVLPLLAVVMSTAVGCGTRVNEVSEEAVRSIETAFDVADTAERNYAAAGTDRTRWFLVRAVPSATVVARLEAGGWAVTADAPELWARGYGADLVVRSWEFHRDREDHHDDHLEPPKGRSADWLVIEVSAPERDPF